MPSRWLVVVALAACNRSALIRGDDTTYRRALDHYKRTREAVAASLAPDDDQAMFMQAQGLYGYRFAPPGRSFGAYVAQISASVIDLPVLDALAGSLDVDTLRLHAPDGAIQIWETLLARHPQSPLRPLALYRLGWAYRNAQAAGFPRDSDEAFDALSTPLALAAKQVPWKSQGAATAWSIVPGLGQMYVGEYGNGAIRLAIALAAVSMIVVPAGIAYERRHDLSWSHDWPLILIGAGGVTILTSDYSSSYADAQRAVLDFNEQTEAAFEDAHPDAP